MIHRFTYPRLKEKILTFTQDSDFEQTAFEVFYYQYHENALYRRFCDYMHRRPGNVKSLADIPFIPIRFFKQHRIVSGTRPVQKIFRSSGTSSMQRSSHHVIDLDFYRRLSLRGFEEFYGRVGQYRIMALLPSYLEQGSSSLVFMVDELMKQSASPPAFYMHDLEALEQSLLALPPEQKVLLFGVSYALIDLAERGNVHHPSLTIIETGGMKGRRKELIKSELHKILQEGFGVKSIHSEYGMTELMSQAWSLGEGLFKETATMRLLIREPNDPLSYLGEGRVGGINVIDLGNLHSCSFIATDDLGKKHHDGRFELMGRFDHSDVRGCNLMAEGWQGAHP